MNTETNKEKRSQSEVIEALKNEAEKNDVFAAVAYVWAQRERARRQVTIPALKQAMEKEGADWPDEKYVSVLKFLSDLGLGVIRTDSKGNVMGLYDVKVTLQSIGQAAAAKRADLKNFKSGHKNKFVKIAEQNRLAAASIARPPFPFKEHRQYRAVLTIVINGAPVIYQGDLEAKDLGELLFNFACVVHSKSGNA